MKYIDFNGLKLSQIALGCDHYGETIREEISLKQLDIFFDQGGTLLDTAHVYGQEKPGGPSTSEILLGKWIHSNNMKDKVVVASKGCHPPKDDLHKSRVSEKEMMLDISQSLDNLKSDCVDIWFFHRDRPDMGVDELVDMASVLKDKKLVSYLGVSNWTTQRIEAANQWADKHGKPRFEISEIQWSLAYCTPEIWGDDTLVCMTKEQRNWYEAQNMPVMCFSPQAKGLFSKVIAQKADTLSATAQRRFLNATNLALMPKVETLSKELGCSPAALALAYLTSQSNPTIAIAGSSKVHQITESLQCSNLTLTAEQLAYLREDL